MGDAKNTTIIDIFLINSGLKFVTGISPSYEFQITKFFFNLLHIACFLSFKHRIEKMAQVEGFETDFGADTSTPYHWATLAVVFAFSILSLLYI